MHMEGMFDTESLQGIMRHIHVVSQTREQHSFTLEEPFENLLIGNSYTIYPLNNGWSTERDIVMVTKKMTSSTNLDSQTIYSVG